MKNIGIVTFVLLLIASTSFGQTAKSTTFKVCKVKKAKTNLSEMSMEETLRGLLMRDAEANQYDFNQPKKRQPEVICSSGNSEDSIVFTHTNPLMQAVYVAYAQHRPLVLSPDMIWLTIAQGLTVHIKENAEEMRGVFVDHAGQVNLGVERLDYQPHSKQYWEDIFPEFSEAIAKNTKEDVFNLITPKFSTTTITEKAAFEITLMDAMSPYFTYSVSISCGIPEITLEGEYEDWVAIEERMEALEKYGLGWWTDNLKEMIQEFKAASKGKVNKKFWKKIFVEKSVVIGCGMEPYYKGWAFELFPYLKNGVDKEGNVIYYKNPLVDNGEKKLHEAGLKISFSDFPSGLSRAKVLLDDNGAMTMLYFNAGFIGFTQNKTTKAIRPRIEWFIVDVKKQPTETELAKYEGVQGKK